MFPRYRVPTTKNRRNPRATQVSIAAKSHEFRSVRPNKPELLEKSLRSTCQPSHTIILMCMNAPRTLKNAPNPVQFLFSPSQSARSINSSGKGLSWVIGIWALDFLFQNPFTVSRWLMRASESPLSGLSTLWSFFVNASLFSACLARALGSCFITQSVKASSPGIFGTA